ncbi:hypothetical protein [Bradyrhizobium guangdongense]|uniref:Uncharacterized protein n=1 Tax=Bradyrhizobium guangdongense TaxID=1325090 RepID=A0A410VEC9_9BRAD|nr:hypothetical protein [Bradyrhizobium guangdongense]QAU42019.1 hypothetical protein X265_33305 [Bradyrhizobium guangdongense]QOZ63078.1 hypothetical protein XH86_33340 [Bradyrhizobium guangdongense]GGI31846.1 hypothetical protein GCM10010987_66440 [Bradyrhizobium guangdongense]
MIIPTHFGPGGPWWRIQTPLHASLYAWAFSRLAFLDLTIVDLRIALATMLTRSLIQAADALARHVMSRAFRGARFAEDITAAATMVAAARR